MPTVKLGDKDRIVCWYKLKAADWRPQHFKWEVKDRVATVSLNRPERKNPLTFESYAELRDTFHRLQYAEDVRVVVFTGEGGNFCSGGDVHDIIGPLVKMDMPSLLRFTRMTGNFVKEMRNCPQPIIAAVDGVCAGAGAIPMLVLSLVVVTALRTSGAIGALTHLLAARAANRVPHHDAESQLLLGGLYLSYGQHRQAATIFERLLADDPAAAVRDRARATRTFVRLKPPRPPWPHDGEARSRARASATIPICAK